VIRQISVIADMNLKKSTIVFAVVGIVIVIANSISALSSQPSFCGLCHGHEYNAWQKSKHSKLNCNFCHRRPDTISFIGQRLDVVRMVVLSPSVLLNRQPVVAKVPSVACRSCHADTNKTVVNKNIRINHTAIVKANYACTECHSTVVHGKAVPNPRISSMDKCVGCHAAGRPGADCKICHVENVGQIDRTFKGPWQITHSKEWRKLHGMGDVKSCQVCHSSDFCLMCHSVTMPHPDSWLNIHGDEARKSRQGCLKCHQESLCNSCHQIEMPHPATFLEAHPRIVGKSGTKVCYSCHQKQGCDRCHAQHIHPGLPKDALKQLRKGMGNGSD